MNNPPAFPLHNHGVQTLGMHFTGMTLRDYFAAQVLTAWYCIVENESSNPNLVAIWCYQLADAMLAAREQK